MGFRKTRDPLAGMVYDESEGIMVAVTQKRCHTCANTVWTTYLDWPTCSSCKKGEALLDEYGEGDAADRLTLLCEGGEALVLKKRWEENRHRLFGMEV